MGGPGSGKFIIKLASDPQPPAGVDLAGDARVPVITDGSDNVWTVTELPDGNYTLLLENFGRIVYIQSGDGNVVGSDKPPTFHWTIVGQDGGPYTIYAFRGGPPTPAWTVKNPEPKYPVTVEDTPQPHQQWNFIPWRGPE